jgi:hypothetical protein
MRQRRGWTEALLEREYGVLYDEIASVVRRRLPEGAGDAALPLEVIERLVARARDVAVAALRRAAESETAAGG